MLDKKKRQAAERAAAEPGKRRTSGGSAASGGSLAAMTRELDEIERQRREAAQFVKGGPPQDVMKLAKQGSGNIAQQLKDLAAWKQKKTELEAELKGLPASESD